MNETERTRACWQCEQPHGAPCHTVARTTRLDSALARKHGLAHVLSAQRTVRYIPSIFFCVVVSTFVLFLRDSTRTRSGVALIKSAMPGQVCVGVGVLVTRSDGAVLLGLRKGAHGSGTWALPGGWLEKNEDFIACAARELEEETGLTPTELNMCEANVLPCVANNVMDKGVHSVTVFVGIPLRSLDAASKVNVREPDKCQAWRWVQPSEPILAPSVSSPRAQPLFPPLEHLIATDYWRTEVRSGSRSLSWLVRNHQWAVGTIAGLAALAILSRDRQR